MKKLRILLLSMLVLLTFACPVSAASQKAVVKKGTQAFLKEMKKMNNKKAKKYLKGETKEQFQNMSGLFKYAFKYNKKYFTYKIKSVTLSKNNTKASVKVTIKYKSLYKAYYHSTLEGLNQAANQVMQGQAVTEKQIYTYIINNMKTNVVKYPPKTKSKKMTIKVVKKGGKWTINQKAIKDVNPFFCDMVKGIQKAQKDFQQ